MREYLYSEFILHNQTLNGHIVDWHIVLDNLLLAITDIGETYLYDSKERGTRLLVRNRYDVTDYEYRRLFSTWLEIIIQYRGMSQTEVSELTGIPQSGISKYVTGKRAPNLITLVRLAEILDVSMDFFVRC